MGQFSGCEWRRQTPSNMIFGPKNTHAAARPPVFCGEIREWVGRERTVPVVAVSLVVEVHLKREKKLGRVLEGGQPTSTSTHKRPTTPTPARSGRTARGSHTPFPGMSRAQKREGRSRGRNRRCRRQGARGGRRLSVGGVWVGVMHLRVDRRRLAPRYERGFMVPERCATVAPVRRSTCACELRSRVGVVKKLSVAGVP